MDSNNKTDRTASLDPARGSRDRGRGLYTASGLSKPHGRISGQDAIAGAVLILIVALLVWSVIRAVGPSTDEDRARMIIDQTEDLPQDR